MRKRKKNNFEKKFLLLPFVLLSLFGLVSYALDQKSDNKVLVENILEKSKKDRPVVYTKQYGDRVITENAKIADDRFKDLTFFKKESLLSNVISSWTKKGETLTSPGLESGTWLWTPIMQITPEYRSTIISGAKKNGINVIYLSIDSYLDIFVMPEGEEKENAKRDFDSIIIDFIKEANKNGIQVDAEAGWQNWAEAGHLYKPGAILDYVINFNKENEEKFRGFQYDVEVYLLPDYKSDKEIILKNFLDLVDKTITKINSSDLAFSVVIPEFYDDSTQETKIFRYNGKNTHALEHLLRILERRKGSKIIVMSYRNQTQGDNGSIKISEDEIYIANEYNTKVVIAQETGDVPPPYITFYNTSKSQYNRQVGILEKTFQREKSFGGIAVHYINSFLELK